MKTIQYKGYDIFLEIQHNGSILATWSNQWGADRQKTVFYDYSGYQVAEIIKESIDESLNKPITYHRPPTKGEINWGAGATHYKDFILSDVVKQCGNVKKWIVCPQDGLRYYR